MAAWQREGGMSLSHFVAAACVPGLGEVLPVRRTVNPTPDEGWDIPTYGREREERK